MSSEKKQCPFCGEEILAVAKKCKHCQSDLGANLQAGSQDAPVASKDYGQVLLAIPIIGLVLEALLILSGNQSSQMAGLLMALVISVIVVTAIFCAMEANKLGMETDKKAGTYSPTFWFVAVVLIWVVFYPMYMLKRRDYGNKNLFLPSVFLALAFVAAPFLYDGAFHASGYKDDIELTACEILTDILQEQIETGERCKVVEIENEISNDIYRAEAVLESGYTLKISIEDRDGYIYVQILE